MRHSDPLWLALHALRRKSALPAWRAIVARCVWLARREGDRDAARAILAASVASTHGRR